MDKREAHLAWVNWYDKRIAATQSALEGLTVARTIHVDAIRELDDKKQ